MKTAVGSGQSTIGARGPERAAGSEVGRRPECATAANKYWPGEKLAAFWRLAPAAVYVAGTEHPVPRRFGDNRGAWPIRIGVTESWKDIITPQLERGSALWWQGVLFRVWTPNEVNAKRLALEVPELVAARIEQLRGSWLDIGVDTDLALLEMEVHHLAERLRIKTWDDDALSRALDAWLMAQAQKRGKGA